MVRFLVVGVDLPLSPGHADFLGLSTSRGLARVEEV
jgi:hypothetical protein